MREPIHPITSAAMIIIIGAIIVTLMKDNIGDTQLRRVSDNSVYSQSE